MKIRNRFFDSQWSWLWTPLLLAAAFPPLPCGPLAAVALIPFFRTAMRRSPGAMLAVGYAAGLIWSAATLYWIAWPTALGFIGAMLILPAAFAVFGCVLSWLGGVWGGKALVTAPFLWAGLEAVSARGDLAFPWNTLAVVCTPRPVWIQFADRTGAAGVSFWIVLLNVLVYAILVNRRDAKRAAAAASGLALALLLPLAYGTREMDRPAAGDVKPVRISLLQGNVDPYKKWTPAFLDSNFIIFDRLTRRAALENGPDLVVWPETATACYLRHRFLYLNWIKHLADSLDVHILTGSHDYDWSEEDSIRTYNAAFLLRPGSWDIDRYCKMRLVPFSERVPWVDRVPALRRLAFRVRSDMGDYTAGDSTGVFVMTLRDGRSVRLSPLICFESVFPDLAARCAAAGAEMLVVITNDGWFGDTSGPRQHAAIASLRAVENRRWIARCANTGVSAFIDPCGRMVSKTRFNREEILSGDVVPRSDLTFFTRHPLLFGGTVLGADLFFLLAALFSRIRSPRRRRAA
ncbi:MAG: apolipoprotein N-acyltransferase [bacterium]|nr:apolipoprotein N-acyltransferase [bacterium]